MKIIKFIVLLLLPVGGFILIPASIIYYRFLLGFICWTYLVFWVLRGTWRFLFQPPAEDSWRFQGEDAPAFFLFADYKFGSSSVGLRGQWLREKMGNPKYYKLEEETFSKRKRKRYEQKLNVYQKELDSLNEKYDVDSSIRKIEAMGRAKDQFFAERAKTEKYGDHAPKIVCPHCGEKGKVWRNENATTEEKTREDGLVGSVIGRKTVTEKKVTQLHCKECGTTWVA